MRTCAAARHVAGAPGGRPVERRVRPAVCVSCGCPLWGCKNQIRASNFGQTRYSQISVSCSALSTRRRGELVVVVRRRLEGRSATMSAGTPWAMRSWGVSASSLLAPHSTNRPHPPRSPPRRRSASRRRRRRRPAPRRVARSTGRPSPVGLAAGTRRRRARASARSALGRLVELVALITARTYAPHASTTPLGAPPYRAQQPLDAVEEARGLLRRAGRTSRRRPRPAAPPRRPSAGPCGSWCRELAATCIPQRSRPPCPATDLVGRVEGEFGLDERAVDVSRTPACWRSTPSPCRVSAGGGASTECSPPLWCESSQEPARKPPLRQSFSLTRPSLPSAAAAAAAMAPKRLSLKEG